MDRGERAVMEEDKVRNWVLGTTRAASVSFAFQMPGRENETRRGPASGCRAVDRAVDITRPGPRRRPRYSKAQEGRRGRTLDQARLGALERTSRSVLLAVEAGKS